VEHDGEGRTRRRCCDRKGRHSGEVHDDLTTWNLGWIRSSEVYGWFHSNGGPPPESGFPMIRQDLILSFRSQM
jgi:hypothetical protein